ncbi:CU044_5270 family protein [Actinoplanes sp. NPDC026619]|uniref:CU044_5270 family protein n=1 Tax=Actinoplanes sp. NPDC026619 TaxID=3155798 RepID=UPI00340B254F
MDKDIEELRGLLPAPVSADLTADRHLLLKEHLMQEFTSPAAAHPQRRRRLVVSLVAATAVAALAAVGAVAGLRGDPAEAPPTQAQAPASSPASPAAVLPDTPVGRFATQVALVAQQSDLTVGKNQFLYVKSRIAFRNGAEKDTDLGLDPLHDREIWLPGDASKNAMVKENGRTEQFKSGQTNEQRFAGLPTDPHKLLDKIYKDTAGTGHGPNEAAFNQIHYYLVEALPPTPELLAALYQAAALIPGVEKVDAVDAIGRHGVALALHDKFDGSRSEWIFNPKTFAYLGERSVQVESKDGRKAGGINSTTAVLAVAVVDKAGQTN